MPDAPLSANSEARRMYPRTVAVDVCPVWAMMVERLLFAFAAVVTKPARKLCPE